jgi:hypothetical protein
MEMLMMMEGIIPFEGTRIAPVPWNQIPYGSTAFSTFFRYFNNVVDNAHDVFVAASSVNRPQGRRLRRSDASHGSCFFLTWLVVSCRLVD